MFQHFEKIHSHVCNFGLENQVTGVFGQPGKGDSKVRNDYSPHQAASQAS